jgi:prevent-host-death family protein
MREASITELRKNIKRLLDAVEAGDTVRVTRNGRTVAEVRPAADRQTVVPAWKLRKAPTLALSGLIASSILIEMRHEREAAVLAGVAAPARPHAQAARLNEPVPGHFGTAQALSRRVRL